ncbi:UvrD-helicase domain-containing protein [Paracoccus marcusii]|uniref:UvrD-helicase domain-containing protein n=1 Tax=Paracoccus marcusii TaxID=59779 RepID=UPI002ED332D7|nr:UvrD-helicase domain-containing protein [Paracoccus marcusii]
MLVIAGAGSGKTAMLAHRVAHLLVTGADPRRILLMTFSRRAASELTRRVERITAAAMGTLSRPRLFVGREPSMPSAHGSCASMHWTSAFTPTSRSMTARIAPI